MRKIRKGFAFTILYEFKLVKIIVFCGNLIFDLIDRRRMTPKKMERILIFRTGAIGDVLMTTPFVRALRNRFPKAHVTYMVGSWAKEAIRGNPNINELIVFDERIFFNIRKMPNILKLIREIRKRKFDLAFILDISFVYPLVAYLAGIPIRVGFDRNGEGFALTHKIEYGPVKHHIEYSLDTLSFFVDSTTIPKDMEITISEKDEEYALRLFSLYKLFDKNVVIGVAPGGAKNPGEDMPIRRWPLEYYAELINMLVKHLNAKVILFGGLNDKELAEKLMKLVSVPLIDLIGKTTLKQAAAIIRKCNLFITHDSGLMHLAAASGTPTISIFGPTNPLKKAPIGEKHIFIRKELPCSPCYKDGIWADCKHQTCLKKIKPLHILQLIKNISLLYDWNCSGTT